MEMNESLSINDLRTNTQKALDYLDRGFFTDSTVTMMTDEYLINSITERLSQLVMFTEGVAVLNEDPSALSKAMLRSSLSEEDVTFILNASLKVSQVSVTIQSTDDRTQKEKDADETPENVTKMIKSKMENMGSLENLIGIIRDSLGTSRIVPIASSASIMEAISQNVEPEKARKDMIRIERPVTFNLDYLDMTKIENSQIFSFLNSLMASDSNSSLSVEFPIKALVDDIKTFYTTDLPAIALEAVNFAKNSAKNTVKFTAEADPYQSLFASL